MPSVRVDPRHQITIPENIRAAIGLRAGDVLEVSVDHGKVILAPKRGAKRSPRPDLSPDEKRALTRAEKKMRFIIEDLLNSKGLTPKETAAAVKAGVIPKNEAYSWTEQCQKDLRASVQDYREGRVSPAFDDPNEAIAYLQGKASKTA